MDSNKPSLLVPDFICIGVQKGGTTTLHHLLSKHPGIAMSPKKELQYFSHNYHLGIDWYLKQWPSECRAKHCGETTPYYVFHPYAAQRIKESIPWVKLIIMLRDPVERALSQYFHSVRLGFEELGLCNALEMEGQRLHGAAECLIDPSIRHKSHQEQSYLSRSRYEQQLPRWFELFPSDQILILRSEDFFLNPYQSWNRILHFLNLEILPFPLKKLCQLNSGQQESEMIPDTIKHSIAHELSSTYEYMRQIFPA